MFADSRKKEQNLKVQERTQAKLTNFRFKLESRAYVNQNKIVEKTLAEIDFQ